MYKAVKVRVALRFNKTFRELGEYRWSEIKEMYAMYEWEVEEQQKAVEEQEG